jgi:C-terminal processing protease CtpA/Prc
MPPVTLQLVEKRLLVEAVKDEALEAAGVRRGLELVQVDGLPVREYAARFVTPYLAVSSPQDRERRSLEQMLLAGAPGTAVKLRFAGEGGAAVEVSSTRVARSEGQKRGLWLRRPAFEFERKPGNVAYVGLNSFMTAQVVEGFQKAWPEIRKASALVVDVRRNGGGNSGFGNQILSYLTAQGGETEKVRTRLYKPVNRAWGMGQEWAPEEKWAVAGRGEDVFRGPMILLTGPGTFSAAEDFSAGFDMLKLGTIVGTATGGSTGQPLMFPLPGGFGAYVCTLQTRYADGREIVGPGVQPHARVETTVADFLAGRDTVLEAALARLSGR